MVESRCGGVEGIFFWRKPSLPNPAERGVKNTNYDGDTNICNGNLENFKSSVTSAIAVITSSRETNSTAYRVVVDVAYETSNFK